MKFATLLFSAAAAHAAGVAVDAGGPQSPPSIYDTSPPSTTYPTSTYYPTSSMPMGPGPVVNVTSTPTPLSATPGGPISNLSTTVGGKPGSSGSPSGSTSVLIMTVSGPNGPTTQTSFEVVTPTPSSGGQGAGSGPSAAPTGTTQPGEAAVVRTGAVLALAMFGGFVALML